MTQFAEDRKREAQERDYNRDRDHRFAMLVPCVDPPYGCSAPAGEECHNIRTGQPLEHQVAHKVRIENGERRAAEQQAAHKIPEQGPSPDEQEQQA